MYRLNHRFQKIKNRRLFPVTYLYSLFWRSPSGVFNYLGTILIVEVSIGCQNARPLTSRRDWCLLSGLDVWLVIWARPLIGYRKPRGWEAGIRRGEWWCGSWRELEESRSTVAQNPCPGQGNSSLWRKEAWDLFSVPRLRFICSPISVSFSRESEPGYRCFGFPQTRQVCLPWGGREACQRGAFCFRPAAWQAQRHWLITRASRISTGWERKYEEENIGKKICPHFIGAEAC